METYRLATQGDGTRLTVDLDTTDEYRDIFEQMFPKALERLKTTAGELGFAVDELPIRTLRSEGFATLFGGATSMSSTSRGARRWS